MDEIGQGSQWESFTMIPRTIFGEEHENLILSEIPDKEAIYDSIKLFLGKGK